VEISVTPELPNLFSLRSSTIRFEGFELKAEVRAAQPSAVILLQLNLLKTEQNKNKNAVYMYTIIQAIALY